MQGNADLQEWRTRLRKRLALAVDYEQPHRVRLCAVRAVQSMLDADNPLRSESADALLSRVLRPFDTREYIVDRRAVMMRVRRPPVSVVDVWD